MKPPAEFKITRLRECPVTSPMVDTPEAAAAYWSQHIATADWFRSEQECVAVLLVNARLNIIGHHMITVGLLDSCHIHPREVLRPAIMHAASAFILMHNHPSGDPSPSTEDLRFTRELAAGAKLLKIQLLDHIIVAGDKHASFLTLGHL